jgi:hypothetical protein
MLENPIFNPTPQTGVKGQNPGITTAKYQFYKGLKASMNLLGLAVKSIIELLRDMVKEAIRPGSTRKY